MGSFWVWSKLGGGSPSLRPRVASLAEFLVLVLVFAVRLLVEADGGLDGKVLEQRLAVAEQVVVGLGPGPEEPVETEVGVRGQRSGTRPPTRPLRGGGG